MRAKVTFFIHLNVESLSLFASMRDGPNLFRLMNSRPGLLQEELPWVALQEQDVGFPQEDDGPFVNDDSEGLGFYCFCLCPKPCNDDPWYFLAGKAV